MRAVDIIRKKRNGEELSREEISFLIQNYHQIPDYQMAAFLMAVFFRSMSESEMVLMTEEMLHSGITFDLSDIPGRKVDKHSTGGVGDKTSLIVAPAVAAGGVTVPMIAGRGLGHTGGTLDKLEAIPGFNVTLRPDQFRTALSSIGVALIGQSEDIAPADRKLYAMRDVTATVDSYPLIASSIMSKKLAEGIDGLVLDVKTGSGAFMRRKEDAEQLAQMMVTIGKACGKKVVALISDMNQPLGKYVGNSLEVMECLEVLKGKGPKDLKTLCEELSAFCFLLGEVVTNLEEGKELYRTTVSSGKALDKFREIVQNQGGNPSVTDNYSIMPQARYWAHLTSPASGYIKALETQQIGLAMCVLGAGRESVDSLIDPAVGMRIHKKIADFVEAGEPLCTLYYNDEDRYKESCTMLLESYSFSRDRPDSPKLIKEIIFEEEC